MFPRKSCVLLQRLALSSGLLGLTAPAAASNPATWPAFSYVRAAQLTPKARPGERPALTIDATGGPLRLTLSQLQAMPAVRYMTEHRQLKKTYTYEGVPLRDLAARGGFAGKDLRVYASNGFFTTIKASDYMTLPIMLAYKADGAAIPVLQKGPLTVVLPKGPARLQGPEYSSAWVWFVERIAPLK
ncbi:hypothetical protein LAJ19_03330 [Deinococcus taeanensis]|uniref:molybdopterin-dependent oxidoreductase n=1 Tax=Deinococcus taeanensis TaxID=2737050 RepID=UPI001CDD4F3A|nr:molybdopterin-dependent oxidoreductase [Deinococcus taeanensis]UBV43263.1 hypothetical protein LAJ19_03330 [Deinococcus taeanensis]